MGKSARKYTPGSNLAKMSPEGRARRERFFSPEFSQSLVDNLNRNVLLEESRRRKLTEDEQQRLDELIEKLKKAEAESKG
jgi:hypothetical protein